MTIRQARAVVVCASVIVTAAGGRARGQDAPALFTFGAHGIGLLTHATETPGARARTEAYLTQPILSAELRARWFHATGLLNLEGLTLRRGELELGAWGEGYVDRRHPHAYLHELMVGAQSSTSVPTSLYAGRGFVPFGSDDPMSRPFVSYPIDHHLAQILERLVLVGAARFRGVALEGATFGGDEPLDPATLPLARRFGDSWAARATLSAAFLELEGSFADVRSPEFREGQGLDQRKAHASLRMDADGLLVSRYALVELGRTTEVDHGQRLYTFDAALAEGALCRGGVGVGLRWERAERPEEERLLDLFRVARPATDLSVLGITEWTTMTAAVSLPPAIRFGVHAAPFLEVARITADRTTDAVFDPILFYGSSRMWRYSVGLRVGAGHEHGRMGRYGAASAAPRSSPAPSGHDHSRSSTGRCFS